MMIIIRDRASPLPYVIIIITLLARPWSDADADDRLFLFSAFFRLEDPHEEMFARDQVGRLFYYHQFSGGVFIFLISLPLSLLLARLLYIERNALADHLRGTFAASNPQGCCIISADIRTWVFCLFSFFDF